MSLAWYDKVSTISGHKHNLNCTFANCSLWDFTTHDKAALLRWRHLVNAYVVKAWWSIPFVDKRGVAGKTVYFTCDYVLLLHKSTIDIDSIALFKSLWKLARYCWQMVLTTLQLWYYATLASYKMRTKSYKTNTKCLCSKIYISRQ